MKGNITLAVAFLGSFLIVGLPYWQIPYSQLSLPSAIWGPALIVVAGLAALSQVIAAARFWRTTLIIGAAVPAVIMVRVLYDVLSDPASHNLWPIEVTLAAGIGLFVAFVGALIGKVLTGRDRAKQ